ncbi:hypothetical protein [Streptomyces sp. Da 82-17]|uniref:hypothetical protein n=1 Tax=Streptomyces sp. Da 82-17 TaxID=3377116 RepID=UPI0038D378C4
MSADRRPPMSARDRLTAMVRTDRGSMTVWSPGEVQDALDAYRTEVLQKAIDRLRAMPVTCTALTGPVWYGTGWNDAIGQLEEIADYQKPDNEMYPGELEHLRALGFNLRAALRRDDLTRAQQLMDTHVAEAKTRR